MMSATETSRHAARQAIAAARPAHARHDAVAAQLAEQLLQIGQGNLLALADAARVTGPLLWRRARSIIAVTAKRPLVVSLMVASSPLADACASNT
jgi:uncharacterized membrane protein YcjF (UPF0283 family)